MLLSPAELWFQLQMLITITVFTTAAEKPWKWTWMGVLLWCAPQRDILVIYDFASCSGTDSILEYPKKTSSNQSLWDFSKYCRHSSFNCRAFLRRLLIRQFSLKHFIQSRDIENRLFSSTSGLRTNPNIFQDKSLRDRMCHHSRSYLWLDSEI